MQGGREGRRSERGDEEKCKWDRRVYVGEEMIVGWKEGRKNEGKIERKEYYMERGREGEKEGRWDCGKDGGEDIRRKSRYG